MFQSEKGNKILSQYYTDFIKVYGELKVLFLFLRDIEMQK